MSIQLFGLPVSRGVAIGRAVVIDASRVDVAHYFIEPSQVHEELLRLKKARDAVFDELSGLKRELPRDAPAELAALLDVHLMLLHDPMIVEALATWVRERFYNAEWAVTAQTEALVRQFDEMEDEYLRERRQDVEQVSERVLRVLAQQGGSTPSTAPAMRDFGGADPLVLVANDIAPADMLQFRSSVFAGFVTAVGGRTSHTAIVARSMGIPAVVGAREAGRLVRQDDWLVVDGEAGVVLIDPSPIVLEEYRFRQRQLEVEHARLDRLRNTPAVTLDGQTIVLEANIELPGDAAAALKAGAVGVGLFRTEFLFMNREGNLPDEEEQFGAYRAVLEAMKGLPVTIRTIDIGADKPLDRMSLQELRREHAMNPALGLRAIRWSLAEPEMFREQLRAILRAGAFGKVRLLIPMVAQRREIDAVFEAIEQAQRELTERGQAWSAIEVGAMVEVPAAALAMPMLLERFDFVSIGTNDLVQYTLAIDRADEAVAHLYDPWHPAVLRLIAGVIEQGRDAGREVAVCGEMAGDPAFTELLLAMGLRTFSMHPSRIATVKQRILRADTQRLGALMSLLALAREPEKAWMQALAGLAAAAPGHGKSRPHMPPAAAGA